MDSIPSWAQNDLNTLSFSTSILPSSSSSADECDVCSSFSRCSSGEMLSSFDRAVSMLRRAASSLRSVAAASEELNLREARMMRPSLHTGAEEYDGPRPTHLSRSLS